MFYLIDYTKSFNKVRYEELIQCIKEINADDKTYTCILCWEEIIVVRCQQKKTA